MGSTPSGYEDALRQAVQTLREEATRVWQERTGETQWPST